MMGSGSPPLEGVSMQPGRKSAASLELKLASNRTRPKPDPTLQPQEQTIFNEVVAGNPHLLEGDGLLLSLYARALSKAMRSRDVAGFERAARVALTIATKLRLTPQASCEPKTVGRMRRDAEESSPLAQYFAARDARESEQEDPDHDD
jgi:hypothetical protein